MTEQQWVSIIEYARLFKVSDMTVRRRIKTGKLRAELKEGKYYIPIPAGASRQGSLDGRTHSDLLIKAHPHPSLFSETQTVKDETDLNLDRARIPGSMPSVRPMVEAKAIPKEIYERFEKVEQGTIDVSELLRFCENYLEQVEKTKVTESETLKAQILRLEEQVRCRDLEITQLRQNVEDLQTLVSILERRMGT